MIDVIEEKRQIAKFLIGGKIIEILSDEDNTYYGFILETPKGKTRVWVMENEECENPAHLDIFPPK